MEGSERADGVLAEVGAHVMGEQLAVAADGSQPEGLVGLQVGEPVVQQVVEGRLCPPTNAAAWFPWTVGAKWSPWRPSAWSSADRAVALVG
jgi:hypothetical protein